MKKDDITVIFVISYPIIIIYLLFVYIFNIYIQEKTEVERIIGSIFIAFIAVFMLFLILYMIYISFKTYFDKNENAIIIVYFVSVSVTILIQSIVFCYNKFGINEKTIVDIITKTVSTTTIFVTLIVLIYIMISMNLSKIFDNKNTDTINDEELIKLTEKIPTQLEMELKEVIEQFIKNTEINFTNYAKKLSIYNQIINNASKYKYQTEDIIKYRELEIKEKELNNEHKELEQKVRNKLEEMFKNYICMDCNIELSDNMKYCSNCGKNKYNTPNKKDINTIYKELRQTDYISKETLEVYITTRLEELHKNVKDLETSRLLHMFNLKDNDVKIISNRYHFFIQIELSVFNILNEYVSYEHIDRLIEGLKLPNNTQFRHRVFRDNNTKIRIYLTMDKYQIEE